MTAAERAKAADATVSAHGDWLSVKDAIVRALKRRENQEVLRALLLAEERARAAFVATAPEAQS